MKPNGHSHTGRGDVQMPGSSDSGGDVPAQALFMDSSQGMSSRTTTHAPSSSSYYQVATPKSPHELTFAEEFHDDGGSERNSSMNSAASMGRRSANDEDVPDGNVTTTTKTDGMVRLSRESEEVERLKYETGKAEILDKLHLHTLIGNKEVQGIQREVSRIDAQMKLLKTLHDDESLLDKIESYHQRETERRKRQILADMSYNTTSNGNRFATNNNSSNTEMNNISPQYCGDSFSIIPQVSQSNFFPLSASSNNAHTPVHHYHTRSKSHGNQTDIPSLRPNTGAVGDIAIPSGVEDDSSAKSNQMNLHHRRNYSSTCLTSNSGVVGKTENNEAIFRRYDGILIVITCSHCGRSGFTSAQGIVNHARLKHSKTYSSQPLAVLNNQILLPVTRQDPEVLDKFKSLEKDPQSEYLPSALAIPSITRREISPKVALPNSKSSSLIVNGVQSYQHQDDSGKEHVPDSTRHLRKAYGREDFKDLVGMVNSTPEDLENALKESTPLSGSEGSEIEGDRQELEQGSKSPSSSNQASSPLSPSRESIKRNNKRRKQDQNDTLRDYKERIKPAEKKARPDVLALSSLPEHERRSSHYNLRAKSKIRSNSDRFE